MAEMTEVSSSKDPELSPLSDISIEDTLALW